MITRISSALVPQSQFGKYLEYVEKSVVPAYEVAAGLISVCLLRRTVVGYIELLTLSLWQSDEALTAFLESQPGPIGLRSDYGAIHMEPHAYEQVVCRDGKRAAKDG